MSGDTPIVDLLTRMTEDSFAVTTLDAETVMLVRIAALIAVDAPPISYVLNLGVAGDLDIDPERVRGVVMAIAPVVGTARVASAMSKLVRAVGIADELEAVAE